MEKQYNVTDFIIKTVYEPLKEFIEHYEAHGMYLPPEFKSDPGEWLRILKEIEYAFDNVYEDKFEGLNSAKHAMEDVESEKYYERVNKGLEYFGKYLLFLVD